MRGGLALEVGCRPGVGAELILDAFGADRVDAFDREDGRPRGGSAGETRRPREALVRRCRGEALGGAVAPGAVAILLRLRVLARAQTPSVTTTKQSAAPAGVGVRVRC
jgi:hypothetical protein